MAEAHKCDRCGKYYDNNTVFVKISRLNRSVVVTGVAFVDIDGAAFNAHDLCDDCIVAFIDFLNPATDEPE